MSIGGPSALGTLLVQKLDAVLGATVSQQSNLVSGARPDAVTPAAGPSRLQSAPNETLRDPRVAVDQAGPRTARQDPLDKSRLNQSRPDPGLARGAPATDSTPSAPTTLGFAAKTILALLNQYPEQPPAIAGKAPLATPTSLAPAAAIAQNAGQAGDAGIAARVFMQALSQALQGSGLFYESHLNDLSFGQRSAASLLSEPQAQLARAGVSPNQEPGEPAARFPATALPGNRADAAESDARIARSDPSPAGVQAPPASGGESATRGGQPAGLHPDTQLLVRQQLEVLANQTLAWHGEAWPDAPMQWEVGREPSAQADDASDHWASRLTLYLPHLGTVQARVNLAGQHVVMHLVAPAAADRLSEQSAGLRSRLLDAGLQLSRLSIAQAELADQSPSNEGERA